MTQTTIQTGDVEIVADVDGPAEGPTVLFLHAGGENRRVWRPVSERLTGLGWRAVVPDLRGHGESGRATDYGLQGFLDDAASICRQLTSPPLVVVGASIGGLLGLHLASGKNRGGIIGLMLLDVATLPSAAAGQRQRAKIGQAHERGAPELKSLDPALISSPLVDELLADPDRWRRAARKVDVPVLLVRGTRSDVVSETELRAFREDVPHGEVTEIEAGHLVARDQPDRLADLLEAFLYRVHRGRVAELP